MTQIFTGLGLGSQGSSLSRLNGYGPKGSANIGLGGESVYVNAANGNVVIKQSDGFLAQDNVSLDLFQSYNSASSGQAWRFSLESQLTVEGAVNTTASSVVRTDEEGHQRRFSYDNSLHAYIADDGFVAQLTFDGARWTYVEGSNPTRIHYNQVGQLTGLSDADGHAWQVEYEDGHLTRIRDLSQKQSVIWSFQAGFLTDVRFESDGQLIHHLHYDYDALGRLQRVSRDLGNNAIYWVAYDYVDDSSYISDIRQTDGSHYHLDYDLDGRITRLTDAEGRYTAYDYDAGQTLVTNAMGERWLYVYDVDARLIGIEGPENYRIRYDYEGHYLSRITQGTQIWRFDYTARGDCSRLVLPTGELILRTFDEWHHVTSETRYATFDSNHLPEMPQTSHFIYNEQGHLCFELTADGVVTEYRYDHQGLRTSSRCYLRARWQGSTPTLDTLQSFCQSQAQDAISLIDYCYDFRGCLSEERHYAQVDATGVGVLGADTKITYSRYDAAARLCEQSVLTESGVSTTHFIYDGLGRLIQTVDNQNHTQRIDYDDAHQRVTKTDANGLQTLSLFDKTGLLLSVHRLDLGHDYGTTTYRYDAVGRLIAETDVQGQTQYWFYDSQGRMQATISFSGQVTEYTYNNQGQCIKTHQYMQTLNTRALTLQGNGFITIKPAASTQDRITQSIYNAYNQVACQIDSTGAVIGFEYDAQGRVITKTAFTNRLNMNEQSGLISMDTLSLPRHIDDRVVTYYYDSKGQLEAEVNGEGSATAYRYDALGNVIEQIRYHQPVTGLRTGDWATDTPAVSQYDDIHIYSFFDKSGLKVADIDAERYLTEYLYDKTGRLFETISYYNAINRKISISEATTLESIRPKIHSNDRHSNYRYNDLNQLIEEKTHQGLVVTYAYDATGLLISKSKMDSQTHETRGECFRYDALGRLIQRLDALGVAYLTQHPALSSDELDTLWQTHGESYTYDLAGHITSKTNALHETTRYVYNDAGLLIYSVSPTGSLVETRYNAFDQVAMTIRYVTSYPKTTPLSINEIQQWSASQLDSSPNEVTHYDYNTLGQLVSQQTGSGSTLTSRYNAFGELVQTQQMNALKSIVSMTDYQYDKRGLAVHRVNSGNGVNQNEDTEYDVFGWVIKQREGLRGLTTFNLNRRGERVKIVDELNRRNYVDYDAFGRTLSADYKTSLQYGYDDKKNTLTLEREGDGATIITQYNAFGDKISIIDGNNQTTIYQYDASGQLIHQRGPEGQALDYEYDAQGQLVFQHDAGGHIHRYTYDADGRMLTHQIDPDGLNIMSTYVYDAIGRQLRVVDAGRCTLFQYDDQGQLIQITQDPDGLNIVKTFVYHDNGQILRETLRNPDGLDKVTAYDYDALGRCVIRVKDPDGLNLKTEFAYDEDNNVISQTDPNQHTTHFVYNASHQVRYQIDARGVVTEHAYDKHHNETHTVIYANRLNNISIYDEATLARSIQPDTADAHQFFAHDLQSRLMFSYDGLGYPTLYNYDKNDNLLSKTEMSIPCDLEELKAGKRPYPLDDAGSRITSFIYDGLNRQRFSINSFAAVTESRYDASGQLIQQIRYANSLSNPRQNTMTSVLAELRPDSARDDNRQFRYDAAGRMRYELSAEGVVTGFDYDAAGNRIKTHQYATRLTLAQSQDPHWIQFIQSSIDDRITRSIFDEAGRERFRMSPSGVVSERRYDAVGNVLAELTTTSDLSSSPRVKHAYEYDAIGRLVSQTDALKHRVRYDYDRNNNVIAKTDENQAIWTYRYNEANQLIETQAPATVVIDWIDGLRQKTTRSIITQNEYDSFGNIIAVTRDAGFLNQRTQYIYDANHRSLQTIYPDSAVNHATPSISPNRQESIERLTESVVYNAFGEVIEKCDKAGFSRHFLYDKVGALVFSVDAEGGVTQYKYDKLGNLSTKTRFAERIQYNKEGLNDIYSLLQSGKHDRHDAYQYDKDHRIIQTHQDIVRFYNAKTCDYHELAPTTQMSYNAFGDEIRRAVQLTETDWAVTTHRYNIDGLKIATLDPEHYLTTYEYNELGLLGVETQYANQTSAIGILPELSSKDRHMRFQYDNKGQLISKTLTDVQVSRLTGLGAQYESFKADLTSYYDYDALGHLVSTTDPEGNQVHSVYNAAGQLCTKIGAKTALGRRATTFSYDALGQLVSCVELANGADVNQLTLNAASSGDIVREDVYDALGHVIQKTDGDGHVTQYSYDANGNIARSWQVVTQANGSSIVVDKRYVYDHENRLLETQTLKQAGGYAADFAQYNAFGEVVKKGVDGQLTTQTDYDLSGRVWRSNTSGYFQVYVYDLSNHVTQVLTSGNAFDPQYNRTGIDLSDDRFGTYIRFDFFDALQHQDNTVDALGRVVRHVQDIHAGRSVRTQAYDRWGNMTLQINANGHQTRYEYNAMDKLIRQTLPEVDVVDEQRTTRRIAPVIDYAVDKVGNVLAMLDANGHQAAHVFDGEGRVTRDIDARGNYRDKQYNLLGQLTQQRDERGTLTSFTYDKNNHLLSINTRNTSQSYEYDEVGQVIRQRDVQGVISTQTYDELGHLTAEVNAQGLRRYDYDSAGHKIAELDADGNSRRWRYDEHGRLREYDDLGGHHTTYDYNQNGLLINEDSSTGKHIKYYYFVDGQIQEYDDLTRNEVVRFSYDDEGQVLSKMTSRVGDWALETDHYEYDALGRLTHVRRRKPDDINPDIPTPDRQLLAVDYEYDAAGNIRDTTVTSNYTGYQATTHQDFFKYDENNRMVVNKGQWINGQITITQSQGSELTYNAAGQVETAKQYEGRFIANYAYHYNEENQSDIVRRNQFVIQTMRYQQGFVVEERRNNNLGALSQYTTSQYENGHLKSQTLYEFKPQGTATHSSVYAYDAVGNLMSSQTHTSSEVNAWNSDETHRYAYAQWDGYLQSRDDVTMNVASQATQYGSSVYRYDVNGQLQWVEDSQAPQKNMEYFVSALDGIRARKNQDGQTSYLTVAGKTIGDLHLDNAKNQHLDIYGGYSPEGRIKSPDIKSDVRIKSRIAQFLDESPINSVPVMPQDNQSTYTLKVGDTLDSIALQLYGDSSLWYLIADANGITDRNAHAGEKGSSLHAGARLILPAAAKNQHNSSQTHHVLTNRDWMGEINPTLVAGSSPPAPPPHTNKHPFLKKLAQIAVAVTAAVVMVMSAGAMAAIATGVQFSGLGFGALISSGLSVLGGSAAGIGIAPTLGISMAAGFVSSIAGQGAANLFGLQTGVDLKGALMTGLGTAATAGLGHVLSTSSFYKPIKDAMDNNPLSSVFNITNATEMMERDAVSQGLNMALAQQQSFDWLQFGTSAATAGIMGSTRVRDLNQSLTNKVGRVGSSFITSEVQALANGMATGHYDAAQILKDNLGSAIGSSLLQPTVEPQLMDEADDNGYCEIPTEEGAYSAIPEGTWERFHQEAAMREKVGVVSMPDYPDNKPLTSEKKPSSTTLVHELSLKGISPQVRFILDVYPFAVAASKASGLSLELTLGQAAQETGWGSKILPGTNNLFNIKEGNGWKGDVHPLEGALEYDKNGNTTSEKSKFRAYKNIEESVKDRVNFLSSNKRYSDIFRDGIKGDFIKEAHVLQNAHYAGYNPYYADSLIKVSNGKTMKLALNFARQYYGY